MVVLYMVVSFSAAIAHVAMLWSAGLLIPILTAPLSSSAAVLLTAGGTLAAGGMRTAVRHASRRFYRAEPVASRL
jgi:hypothetical protein